VSLLSGEFSAGETVLVDVDPENEKLIFSFIGEAVPAEEIQSVESQS
jgi:hypothetical protein